MTKRREFATATKVEIVKRATGNDRSIRCEECGSVVKPGAFAIDHIKPDGLEVDKTTRLTADKGQLLCLVCHKAKTTKQDVPAIAKAKEREALDLGLHKEPTMKSRKKETKPPIETADGMPEIWRRFH